MTDHTPAGLARLVGARLVALGRAADLQHFTFESVVGLHTAALHVSCPWRFASSTGIVVGATDYWRPADTPDDVFDTDVIGTRLRDVGNEAVRRLIETRQLVVLSAMTDRLGGLRVELSHGYTIEVFPDASRVDHDEREFWRLFEPGGLHLIFSSDGLDYGG